MTTGTAKARILDLGCGRVKAPGSIGVDSNLAATAADVIADLNCSLPFADGTFEHIRAVHVIEHLTDVMKAVAEMHRVAKPGGTLYIVTPHYTDFISWCDPTHRWHLNSFSFRYFGPIHGERHWYTSLQLRPRSLRVELARLWKWLGFHAFVNLIWPTLML